jgi:hypothetical protein
MPITFRFRFYPWRAAHEIGAPVQFKVEGNGYAEKWGSRYPHRDIVPHVNSQTAPATPPGFPLRQHYSFSS